MLRPAEQLKHPDHLYQISLLRRDDYVIRLILAEAHTEKNICHRKDANPYIDWLCDHKCNNSEKIFF